MLGGVSMGDSAKIGRQTVKARPAGPQARHAARLLSPPQGRSGNQAGNCPARPRAAVRSPARRLAGRAA
nr:hypothetical protein orf21 [uncultured bacterium]